MNNGSVVFRAHGCSVVEGAAQERHVSIFFLICKTADEFTYVEIFNDGRRNPSTVLNLSFFCECKLFRESEPCVQALAELGDNEVTPLQCIAVFNIADLTKRIRFIIVKACLLVSVNTDFK
jgi:hypothetical protein